MRRLESYMRLYAAIVQVCLSLDLYSCAFLFLALFMGPGIMSYLPLVAVSDNIACFDRLKFLESKTFMVLKKVGRGWQGF